MLIMSSFDFILKLQLQRLAQSSEQNEALDAPLNINLPFGQVAFFRDSAWKNSSFWQTPKSPRHSHPGLSLSSSMPRIAFGTSKLKGKNPNSKTCFFVDKKDCNFLKKPVVFLLNSVAPLSVFNIDYKFGDSATISQKRIKELKEKLKNA